MDVRPAPVTQEKITVVAESAMHSWVWALTFAAMWIFTLLAMAAIFLGIAKWSPNSGSS